MPQVTYYKQLKLNHNIICHEKCKLTSD